MLKNLILKRPFCTNHFNHGCNASNLLPVQRCFHCTYEASIIENSDCGRFVIGKDSNGYLMSHEAWEPTDFVDNRVLGYKCRLRYPSFHVPTNELIHRWVVQLER